MEETGKFSAVSSRITGRTAVVRHRRIRLWRKITGELEPGSFIKEFLFLMAIMGFMGCGAFFICRGIVD